MKYKLRRPNNFRYFLEIELEEKDTKELRETGNYFNGEDLSVWDILEVLQDNGFYEEYDKRTGDYYLRDNKDNNTFYWLSGQQDSYIMFYGLEELYDKNRVLLKRMNKEFGREFNKYLESLI